MLLIVVAYCAAGIFHLVFQLLGSSSQPFEVTFRAYCYAVAPASVFRLIPICGDILFFIAGLVLLVFSFRETLRVDGARATIGVMLPSLLCCGFIWAAGALPPEALSRRAFSNDPEDGPGSVLASALNAWLEQRFGSLPDLPERNPAPGGGSYNRGSDDRG